MKSGKKDICEDPTQPTDARVAAPLRQMTLEEKKNQPATNYGYKKVGSLLHFSLESSHVM